MIIQSCGMNTQEGGQMCQVLAEHAQTLGTTHKGGVVVMQRFSPSTATSGSRARPTYRDAVDAASESARTASATPSTPLTATSSQY